MPSFVVVVKIVIVVIISRFRFQFVGSSEQVSMMILVGGCGCMFWCLLSRIGNWEGAITLDS